MAHIMVRDDYPPHTPGDRCWLCGSPRRDLAGRRERVIDPNVLIHMEGPLAFCESCVREMGRLIGMCEPEDLERAAERATDWEVLAIAAAHRAEEAEEALQASQTFQAWASSTTVGTVPDAEMVGRAFPDADSATPEVSTTVDKSGTRRRKQEAQ